MRNSGGKQGEGEARVVETGRDGRNRGVGDGERETGGQGT